MKHWNIPLQVLVTLKKLTTSIQNRNALTLNYESITEALSQCEVADTVENKLLLKGIMAKLNDKNIDYHIMNLEGLLSNNEAHETLTLREKMERVYQTTEFDAYRAKYGEETNALKSLFLECVSHVSVMQEGQFVVLKYRPEVSYYDLWNEFYMETRGVVLDVKENQLVTAPYRKFFNYNEKPLTSPERINRLIKHSISLSIQNKEDGSMVGVTRYEDDWVVSTPGSLGSEQAKWAKVFLLEHHHDFLLYIPMNVTFIFEAVYPDNRIVVDYRGAEKLILTGARRTTTGEYLSREELVKIAVRYRFAFPATEDKSLQQLLVESTDKALHPANEKEGWVFTIQTTDETLLFKVKCEDYCEIHKIIGVANSPKVIFNQIVADTFDDFISKVPDALKQTVLDIAEVIWTHIKQTESEAKAMLSTIPNDFKFTLEDMRKNTELKEFVKNTCVPLIDKNLSRSKRTEMEELLIATALGKKVEMDKFTRKEFDRLWVEIPHELKNQSSFKQKEGRLLGFIHQRIPEKFRTVALDYARGYEVNYLSLVDFKVIDFSFVNCEGVNGEV